jgi:hypothetical protein
MLDFDFSVEHVLILAIAILLLLILVKKTNICQKICINGFKVGGQMNLHTLPIIPNFMLPSPPPSPPLSPPPPPPTRPPLPQTEVDCNNYFNRLGTICPEDHVDNRCCNGTSTIWGLNSLSGSCILSLSDPSINSMTPQQQIILNNYNTCQHNFPDISAKNTIFTVFTDENDVVPPIYLPILQNLEMIRRKTGKKTYEIISGSNLKKYNRLMNYVNWSKQNNMKTYTHQNDSDGFTVGGQPAASAIGTIVAGVGAGITCTQYFISGKDDDKENCKTFSKLFGFGCLVCWCMSGSSERSNVARRLTTDRLANVNEVLARPINPIDLNRPPTIVSDELRQQLTQEQIDELENPTDLRVQLTEEQEEQVLMASVVTDEDTSVAEGQVINLEGQLIQGAEVIGDVDEEIVLEGPE